MGESLEDRVEEIICEILHHDGPDKHIDGHEELTSFVMSVITGDHEVWLSKYMGNKPYCRHIDPETVLDT